MDSSSSSSKSKFPPRNPIPMDSSSKQQQQQRPKVGGFQYNNNHNPPSKGMIRSSSTNSEASYYESPHHFALHQPEPDETPFTSASATPLPLVDTYSPAATRTTKTKGVRTTAAATTGRAEQPNSSIIGIAGGVSGGLYQQQQQKNKSKGEDVLNIPALGFRLSEVIFCLISLSVMAANKTQGWSGDSYDRYIEYRYCLGVNVIGFVYSGFQAMDVAYYLISHKHIIRCNLRYPLNFFIDQILAYLLISASSASASRVIDWQSNWGKDEFTQKASVSVAMALLAFVAFAFSSLISGYNLSSHISSTFS